MPVQIGGYFEITGPDTDLPAALDIEPVQPARGTGTLILQ
jgi:hypothetical protein